jgi:1,4-dihydroxy-2-naphthoate octaprenyltransferase
VSNLKYVLGPMRLPFLVITPACVLTGLGTAVWSSTEKVSGLYFFLALIGGICAHISVNSFNEYFDFKSGLDARTIRTPFSGGSGTLQEKPEFARQALITALTALAIVGLIGLYFLYVRGLALLPLGVLGLFVIAAYTPWFAHNPFLSLISPGVGFGILMVMGTDFVLTGRYSWTAFIASLVPFFLVSDLLLLNQFPDIEADRSVGRRNFPILLGARKSSLIYGAFLLMTYLSIIIGIILRYLPWACILGLLTVVIAVPAFIGAYRHGEDIKKLMPYLVLNVIINVVTPILVAVGLFLG